MVRQWRVFSRPEDDGHTFVAEDANGKLFTVDGYVYEFNREQMVAMVRDGLSPEQAMLIGLSAPLPVPDPVIPARTARRKQGVK